MTVMGAIREHIEDLETHKIDELIFRAFPLGGPFTMGGGISYLLHDREI